MDCNNVSTSSNANAVSTTTLCIRTADAENINPVASTSTALALVTNNEVVSPDEEAVCAVDWHPGIPDNNDEGDETDKCPDCGLGFLRWFYLNDESLVKLCNNVLCNYPFDCDDPIETKPKSAAEMEIDSEVFSLFDEDDHTPCSRSPAAETSLSQMELLGEMQSLIDKYIDDDETDKPN